MPIPDRKTSPTSLPDLSWLTTDDGSRSLINKATGVSYHSGCGAVSEALVVYLLNSGVARRLADGLETKVFELGFGTGMNMLLTAAMAERCQTKVELVAVENRLLPANIFREVNLSSSLVALDQCWPSQSLTTDLIEESFELVEMVEKRWLHWLDNFIDDEGKATAGQQEVSLDEAPRVVEVVLGEYSALRLHLMAWSDFLRLSVQKPTASMQGVFQAVYFDPFCPETSPELWQESVFRAMAEMLEAGGRLASYCVKGEIRRRIQSLGFEIDKQPGPIGGKREVLVARNK